MVPFQRHFSQQITQHIARDIVSIKVSEPKELGRNGQALPILADKLGKNGFVCGHLAGIALCHNSFAYTVIPAWRLVC